MFVTWYSVTSNVLSFLTTVLALGTDLLMAMTLTSSQFKCFKGHAFYFFASLVIAELFYAWTTAFASYGQDTALREVPPATNTSVPPQSAPPLQATSSPLISACLVIHVVQATTMAASAFSIIGVCVERLLAVRCPTSYAMKFTAFKTALIIFFIWTAAVMVGGLPVWLRASYFSAGRQTETDLKRLMTTLNQTRIARVGGKNKNKEHFIVGFIRLVGCTGWSPWMDVAQSVAVYYIPAIPGAVLAIYTSWFVATKKAELRRQPDYPYCPMPFARDYKLSGTASRVLLTWLLCSAPFFVVHTVQALQYVSTGQAAQSLTMHYMWTRRSVDLSLPLHNIKSAFYLLIFYQRHRLFRKAFGSTICCLSRSTSVSVV